MSNNKLVLIGGGGHCKSVISSLNQNDYNEIVIIDPNLFIGDMILGIRVVGNDDSLLEMRKLGFECAFISVGSIGNISLREKLHQKVIELGYNLVNVIDKTAIVDRTVILGKGIFIGKRAVVNSCAILNDNCIINTGAIVEHDCKIGMFSHVAPGAIICGSSVLGYGVHAGAGCCVRQESFIADHVILGIGSALIGDTESDRTYIGIPAKEKR